MRYFFFTIIIFISLQSYAQQNRIKLGFQFSQDNISGDGNLKAGPDFTFNRIERDEFNFSTGLTIALLTNSNFSFQSGLIYSQKDFASSFYCPSCFYRLSIYLPPSIDIKNRFISVPFLVRFDAGGKKLNPFVEAGINNNFLLNDGDFNKTKPAFMETVIGLGLGYNIGKKLGVELKYNYRSALTVVYKDLEAWEDDDNNDPNKFKTNSFQLGLSYIIK